MGNGLMVRQEKLFIMLRADKIARAMIGKGHHIGASFELRVKVRNGHGQELIHHFTDLGIFAQADLQKKIFSPGHM